MDVLAAIAAPSVSIVVGTLLYGVVLGVVTFMAMAGVRRRTRALATAGAFLVALAAGFQLL